MVEDIRGNSELQDADGRSGEAVDTSIRWETVRQFQQRNPNLSVNFIYSLCAQGELRSIKVRGKVLVASDALERLAAVGS